MPNISEQRRSLLSSQARVQTPFIKVTIGSYTFGIYSKTSTTEDTSIDGQGFYAAYDIKYPNYLTGLTITKVNGQVNQYSLNITYPVVTGSDPNFFEKVFSSVSSTRKITFTYGDYSTPFTIYKEEEAIITGIQTSFDLNSSAINYVVSAVSGAALARSGIFNFIYDGEPKKPSDEIKRIFKTSTYGLLDLFTGMSRTDGTEDLDTILSRYIDGSDKAVVLESKLNVSVLEYIQYLVSCMIPSDSTTNNISDSIYILTIHDETTYDKLYNDYTPASGPYFKVTRTSYLSEQSDAYNIDIGFNTSTIVQNFSIQNNENYSILYDYQDQLVPEKYVRRLDSRGNWHDVYAPVSTSRNDHYETKADDITWWTKITKYPINATIRVQGLLRPSNLMTYVRLNVVFPGGRKHISSGLYIITRQVDTINYSGYITELSLTRISGDNGIKL